MLRDVVVVGATGRLGSATLKVCDPGSAIAGVRSDYEGLPSTPLGSDGFLEPRDLIDKQCVINCAGRTHGTAEELYTSNVDLPAKLARQAREAGVRHFLHISSFRVYGRPEIIASDTPTAPQSDYGKSKLKGEEVLMALSRQGFEVTCLRLPFMFSADTSSLLKYLVRYLSIFPVLPVPRSPAKRSMISFEDAAHVIHEIVERRVPGIIGAADPTIFTYGLLREVIRRGTGKNVALIELPDSISRLVAKLIPRVQNSLFSSNCLMPEINFAQHLSLPLGLEAALARLVQAQGAPRMARGRGSSQSQ